MKLLAFDQASAKSAYSIFEDGVLQEYYLIDIKNKDAFERFKQMCIELQKTIINTKPDLVVFEDISLQTNPFTLILLGRIQGAIIGCCLGLDIPYEIYKPSSWRKQLGFKQGRGIARKELKKQAIDYVQEHYGLTLKDDLAESICIGETCVKINYKEKIN